MKLTDEDTPPLLQSDKSKSRHIIIIGLAFAIAVVVIWLLFWRYTDDASPAEALFTGLAFVGVILTIFLQRDELQLQRQELSFTREEIRRQREQMELQNATLKRQQFEATFFQMLQVFNDCRSSMRWNDKPFETSIRGATQAISGYFREERKKQPTVSLDSAINWAHHGFFVEARAKAVFAPYFMLLYNIIKLVDATSEIEDKKKYTNVVRAQLTDDELFVLFFNGLSIYGRENFKPLIEKYSLLKHLDTNQEIIKISRSAETQYLLIAFNEK